MNKIPKAYQSSTPTYQLIVYSVFLAVLLAAFSPMAQASCGGSLMDHSYLKSETVASNNIDQRLKEIPKFNSEPVFAISEHRVLSWVGELSIVPVEGLMSVKLSLSIRNVMELRDMDFAVSSSMLPDGSLNFHFAREDVTIDYQPRLKQIEVMTRTWEAPLSLRLNPPNEPIVHPQYGVYGDEVGPI